jgi:hypothetical protein
MIRSRFRSLIKQGLLTKNNHNFGHNKQLNSTLKEMKPVEKLRQQLKISDEQLQEMSWKDRFKNLSKQYGSMAVIIYLSMSTTTLSLIYLAISNGIDVETRLRRSKAWVYDKLGISMTDQEEQEMTEFQKKKSLKFASTFLVAFAANKLLSPLKIMLTVLVTPSVAKWWRRR